MTNDNRIFLWKGRIRVHLFIDCAIHYSDWGIVHCIFSGIQTYAKLIRNREKCQSELIFSWDEVICRREAMQSALLVSLVISCPEMYFNSVEDTVSAISYGSSSFSPSLPLFFVSFSSSGLLLGDEDPTKDCAWVVQGLRGGIREARRRLVRCGTLSLKYPEVFFPRNCRSPSFLGSLNGPGYPGRIEKLPSCFTSLSLSSSLSFQPVFLALVPFFLRFCSRSNLYAPPPRKQPPITRQR